MWIGTSAQKGWMISDEEVKSNPRVCGIPKEVERGGSLHREERGLRDARFEK